MSDFLLLQEKQHWIIYVEVDSVLYAIVDSWMLLIFKKKSTASTGVTFLLDLNKFSRFIWYAANW